MEFPHTPIGKYEEFRGSLLNDVREAEQKHNSDGWVGVRWLQHASDHSLESLLVEFENLRDDGLVELDIFDRASSEFKVKLTGAGRKIL
jgi:hypothetical protein